MRIVIVGTGTEIGKTHVTACLLAYARSRGRRVQGYKPVATGIADVCDDAEQHAIAARADYLAPTFAYRRPVSPHLAAREEGRPIDLAVIQRRAVELEREHDAILVESAGGLFSPLSETLTNVDLVEHLAPAAVVLVAPDRLGVLHDVGACLAAARARGVVPAALVLSTPSNRDGCPAGRGNGPELDRIGLGPVAGTFPFAAIDDPTSHHVAAKIWSLLMRAL